jgi:tetratricopeptide (TPR) repeat protein
MNRVVCVCIFVASLAATSGCGVTKQAYLAKGNALFAAGKYADASLNFRKAIQKDPAFGEAYYRLGLASMKLGQGMFAYSALLHATELLPGNQDAQEKFSEVCLSLYLADRSRPQVLYTQIAQLSRDLLAKNANSYQGWLLRGYLASTDKKLPEAIEDFRKALQLNSSNPGAVTELAHLLIQNGQTKAGEVLALDLISRQKTTYGAVYDLLYDFYLKANLTSDAESVLKSKVNNNPKEADYVLELVRHYSHQNESVKMQAALRRLLDDPQDYPNARLQVGDFYLEHRDYSAALRYYQEGLNANPESKVKAAYQKRSVVALLDQGNTEAAARLAEQVLKENPNDSEALHLDAGILLNSGKRENADLAVREFRALTSEHPNDATLLLQLGQSYRLKGDLIAARGQFTESIKKQGSLLAARYELAEVSLLTERPADAVQQANKILEARPKDRRARLLRTSGWIQLGEKGAASFELAQLIQQLPSDTEPQLQLGLLALSERKYPNAIVALSKVRGSADPRVATGLAVAYLHQHQYDQARDAIQDGLRRAPNSPELLEQLPEIEALSGHNDLAIAGFEKLISADPKSVKLRERLAEVYDLKGDHANEVATYRQACELAPNDPTPALSLADALARAGRIDQARAQFQQVVKTYPLNAPALNNAAFFLADSGGDLDEALRLAERALQRIPNQPVFSDTVGYIYLKKGLNDSAVQTFSNLARKYPFAIFHYHLGLALYAKGDKTTARKELRSALSGNPSPEDKARIRELLNKLS